ncbi:hypothetical protein HNO88_002442 [Novosphingobium chloroacetimidivorans]|uniref:Uncharacterized protein n=1 Tax=Novosphingobium chloroacetimidivorans TaxID=1428314 RepID=A0A7W7NWA3_9SPHN|nr:hypothetical protein [Novosphingobium chloroacetimidivorans]
MRGQGTLALPLLAVQMDKRGTFHALRHSLSCTRCNLIGHYFD